MEASAAADSGEAVALEDLAAGAADQEAAPQVHGDGFFFGTFMVQCTI